MESVDCLAESESFSDSCWFLSANGYILICFKINQSTYYIQLKNKTKLNKIYNKKSLVKKKKKTNKNQE